MSQSLTSQPDTVRHEHGVYSTENFEMYASSSNNLREYAKLLARDSFKVLVNVVLVNVIKVPGREEKLTQLVDKLRSYASLPDDWDCEGSQTPHQKSIDDALTFLANMPEDLPIPFPEAGPEGDIGMYWDNRKTHTFAHVLFDGDGCFAYIATIKRPNTERDSVGNDGLSIHDPLPNELVRVIRM